MNRGLSHHCGRAGLLACALLWGFHPLPAPAQAPLERPAVPPAPAQFDPAEVYFQAWLLTEDARKLSADGKHEEAYEKLQRAQQLFDRIKSTFPDWRQEMLDNRRDKTKEQIAGVIPEVVKARGKRESAMAELEGRKTVDGVVPGASPEPLDGGIPAAPIPPARSAETLASRRIAELEGKVRELQSRLTQPAEPNAAARDASRLGDVSRQRDLLQAELKQANDELQRTRARYTQEPMHQEIEALTGRIQGLEREKSALGQALEKSRQETRRERDSAMALQAQIDALQAERGRLLQENSDLQANLEREREKQNEVIAGQRRQLGQLQEELRLKGEELSRANQRIASLETQLAETRQSFEELQEERDGLLRERDQMAALLKLNDNGQLQQIIDQNMKLDRELREANNRKDRLAELLNASQDEQLEAIRNISVAKANINLFKRENAAQQQRIAELENRLKNEDRSLAQGGGDPREVEMLRGIIQKQLRIQERRRQARELLIEALGEKSKDDPSIAGALELFNGAEIPLSPEELRLVDGTKVDNEFVSPFARDRGSVDLATGDLQREVAPLVNAAKRAYVNGRYQSCRELFEMVLERHPGDTATLCRLGNVHLRLEDPMAAADAFRRASELDTTNPYAFRMLGHALMQPGNMQDSGEALHALQRSVELAPTNAEGRMVLGNLLFQLGQMDAAEEQYKTTIACDDTMSEAYFNLAFLYAERGRKKQGLEYYKGALERGAEPDPALEKRLAR